MKNTDIVRPGAVIGMLGDGQLGKMSVLAGVHLGYKFAVLGPEGRNSPAGQAAWWAESWGEGYSHDGKIEQFAHLVRESGGVVTLEWENVPLELITRLEKLGVVVRPGANVLTAAQDRYFEKRCAAECKIRTANYTLIATHDELRVASLASRFPAILKTRRDGYDGKGQVRVTSSEDLARAWDTLKNVPCVLEEVVNFVSEISVIIARKPAEAGGEHVAIYEPFENRHEKGILRQTTFPAIISTRLQSEAQKAAHRIASHLGLHGLLAIEFFVTEADHVIFNEMAPRPHNSGHVTIESCYVSQFEHHIRAICNLPFKTTRCHTPGKMTNILGDETNQWETFVQYDCTKVHVYGKREVKPGRKMGHFTSLTI